MSLVFIALQLSQPRCIKRIKAIYDAGVSVKVYGFDSGLYNDSLKNLPFPVEKIIKRDKNLGKINKILSFRSYIKNIFKENNKTDLYYFFGYEIAAIAYLLGCKNYIYEEADVTAARVNNELVRKVMLDLDRRIIIHSYRTVLTSGGFVPYIFPKGAPQGKIIMMPNKLSSYFNEDIKNQICPSVIDIEHIQFGFIGLIRYPNTIVRFAKVIGQFFPHHEFHFWGQPEKQNYLDDVKDFKNIFFHGSFKNPDDLKAIYEKTDISIVCYDTSSGNVRIAEPNKLYESIFFETPIVVSNETYLEERVNEYGIGFSVNASDDQTIIEFVNSINLDDLRNRIDNIRLIPWQKSLDNSDELIESIIKFKEMFA